MGEVIEMPTRKIGSQGLQVSAVGLGCMSMTMSQPSKSPQQMIQLLHTSIDSGVTFLDTSDVYGSMHANELLIGQVIEIYQWGWWPISRGTPLSHPFIIYAPLGKGFFSAGPNLTENLLDSDLRKHFPRLQGENLKQNMILFERVTELAKKKGCTTSQLALAWVLHQGDDVSPIPGTTKIENFKENIGAISVKLSKEDMGELEEIASLVKGDRYPDAIMQFTWKHANTPPLSSWKPI